MRPRKLPVALTGQPPARKRAAAMSASPSYRLLFRTVTGTSSEGAAGAAGEAAGGATTDGGATEGAGGSTGASSTSGAVANCDAGGGAATTGPRPDEGSSLIQSRVPMPSSTPET